MTSVTSVTNVSKPGYSRKQISVLTMNTLAFAVNFAVWVMFSVIGIKIKAELNLNETEFGLLVATPVLTGSLVRLPLGILTDRYGGRIVYFLQMLSVVIPSCRPVREIAGAPISERLIATNAADICSPVASNASSSRRFGFSLA